VMRAVLALLPADRLRLIFPRHGVSSW
jgi:hypothetical protein